MTLIEPARDATSRRLDIQVLRGLAVLMVVIFHALPKALPGGLLGVDVFFVISGFLITGHILQDLEARRFTLGGFYLRRARRLLPAAWTTLFVTTLLAYPILTSAEWRQYLAQLLGALTFTANFVLAKQSGYFEVQGAAKPLLHIWSLSLEEQFYFFAPLILMMVGRRWRIWVLLAGALLSLALCIVMASGFAPDLEKAKGVSLAFYMLPTRAWELLAGGLAGWAMIRRPGICAPLWSRAIALLVIGAVAWRPFDPVHPRGDAILVVAATAVLLLGNDRWVRQAPLIVRPLAAVGDWSYSIYLIHWPLLALAYVAWVGDLPPAVAITIAGLSIPLGWAQYRCVERPFLKPGQTRRWFAFSLAAGAAAFVAVCAPAAWASYSAKPVAPAERRGGLAMACARAASRWEDLAACKTSAAPTVAVWGDSYAAHLVPGLLSNRVPLVQITKNGCAPVPGITQLGENYTPAWARDCISFTQSALSGIAASPTVRTVVISSPFNQVFTPGERLFVDGHIERWTPIGVERLAGAVRRLQKAGKTVIIVGPPPSGRFDAAACNRRLREHLPVLGRADCAIDLMQARGDQPLTVEAVNAVGRLTGATVLWPKTVLCRGRRCDTTRNGVLLYRDEGHLTVAGSILVVNGLGLGRLVAR